MPKIYYFSVFAVEAITKKCEGKGYSTLTFDNFWWLFLMKTNQVEAAEKLWNEKIKSNPNTVVYGVLSSHIKRSNDADLAKALVNMVRCKEGVSAGSLGYAYGTLISVLSEYSCISSALAGSIIGIFLRQRGSMRGVLDWNATSIARMKGTARVRFILRTTPGCLANQERLVVSPLCPLGY